MEEIRVCASHTISVAMKLQDYGFHGHDLTVEVCIRPQRLRGVVAYDVVELRRLLQQLLAPLDHTLLNESLGVEDASGETLALWVAEKLEEHGLQPVLVRVRLGPETWIELVRRAQGNGGAKEEETRGSRILRMEAR